VSVLRLFNVQGIVGLVASLALLGLLLLQKGETRHWRKQSGQFEQLYRDGQSAFARTVADYRAAADAARSADRAAADRLRASQNAITQRSTHDLEIRLADARARADRMRGGARAASADSGRGRATAMPTLPGAAGSAAQAAGQGGLPPGDALSATEQAIQLDELIKWVRRQSALDPNARP
jgi:hypothetical protein